MRSRLGGLLGGAFIAVGSTACVTKPALHGPLPVRNQHPAQLTVMHMAPATAAVLPAGGTTFRADAAYSSLWLIGGDSATFVMDGEYLRAATSARVGLGRGVEIGIEVPVAHTSGGFLDDFVIDYHELFGMPDQGRTDQPRDQFSIEAFDESTEVWAVDRDSLELLDVPITLGVQVLEPGVDRFGVQLRGGVELPTGDDDRGYGNGEVDFSFGAVVDYRLAGIGLFGHVQHTFAGTPDQTKRAGTGLEFADVTSAGLAAELPLASDLAAFVQVEWENSTLRDLREPVFARDQVIGWVGARWFVASQWGLEVGFGEDLQTLVSPDFTAWLGCVWIP